MTGVQKVCQLEKLNMLDMNVCLDEYGEKTCAHCCWMIPVKVFKKIKENVDAYLKRKAELDKLPRVDHELGRNQHLRLN